LISLTSISVDDYGDDYGGRIQNLGNLRYIDELVDNHSRFDQTRWVTPCNRGMGVTH